MNAQKDKRWIICLLLAAAVAAVYWQAKGFEFVNIDDNVYVSANEHVKQGLTWTGIKWAFSSGECSNWHPLTWISHMADWQLYGKKAGGHHITSVLFHIANTVLVFLILGQITGRMWPSAFVAAVFGLHPLRAESVAWIAERKDVLSMFFFLLSVWAYAGHVERMEGGGQKPVSESNQPPIETIPFNFLTSGFYLLSLAFFALGLMAKSMLVTMPFVLLLLDYWPFGRFAVAGQMNRADGLEVKRRNPWLLVVEKTPFFALTVGASVAAFLVQKSGGAVTSLDKLPFFARLGNSFVAYAHYLGSLIWPHKLAVLYPHPGFQPLWLVVGSAGLLVAISVIVALNRGRAPWLVVGWLWYLGTLVPVIGLVQIGVQSWADRYTYLPLLGVVIAIVWTLASVGKSHGQILWAGAMVVVGTLMALSWRQAGYWRNDITLFTRALESTTDNAIAHNNLGFALARQGKFEEALPHHLRAVEINPDYHDARFNLALDYSETKRWDDAHREYTAALRQRPDAQAFNNLGTVYANTGRYQEAIEEYKRAVEHNPKHAEARYNWGLALGRLNRPAEEIEQYKIALELQPDYLMARSSLGTALLRRGNLEQARKEFQAVLELEPGHLTACNNLGATYLREERYAEAIAAYRQALKHNPNSFQAHYNLGVALLKCKQEREAAAEFKAALDINPNLEDARRQLAALSAILGKDNK